MSQKQNILSWLRSKPITQLEASERFGCWRLAARIKELRDDGHNIETLIEPNANKGIHGVYKMRPQ